MSTVSTAERSGFQEDGYLIVRNVLEQTDVDRMLEFSNVDPQLKADTKNESNFEGEGVQTRLVYREGLSEDIYSAYGRSTRIVDRVEGICEERVRHYYHLNMQKEPNTGGWQYHQDYGYHYNEFLYPRFVSVMIALNAATRENGYLKVVRGSHKLGLLEHEMSGSQLIANKKRVALALQEMEEVHCEVEPGGALFFDGNILHASDANLSDKPRWSMIYAYVPESNTFVLDDPHPGLRDVVAALDETGIDASASRHWAAIQAAIA